MVGHDIFYITYTVQLSGCGLVPDQAPGNYINLTDSRASAVKGNFTINVALYDIKDARNDPPSRFEIADCTQKTWKKG